MSRTSRLRWAAVVVAGALLAGCGVPVGDRPSIIASGAVPPGLLRPTSPQTTTTPAPVAPDYATIAIYFVGPSTHLVAVNRDVQVAASQLDSDAGLTAVVQALVSGPTTAEAAAGAQTELPSGTKVLNGTGISGGIATVNFSASFGQLAGQTQIEAVAQVVYTVIGAIPQVTGVSFQIDGQRAQVPSPPAGALVNVATRTLYASLGP